jgi:RimJ/RimL family protein N-acetyltransferase
VNLIARSVPDFRIETERLILREWREEDRPVLKSIINTPAMLRYFGDLMSDAEYDAFFERRLDEQKKVGGLGLWAVTQIENDQLIGTCGLRKADDYPPTLPVSGMYEIGWRIGEAWWRQGFALEAACACIDWFWANTGADVLAAWTAEGNLPSQALMKRLGMSRRMDLDFDHPGVPDGCPLKRHVTYSISRPMFPQASP